MTRSPRRIEILTFNGCPHGPAAIELVGRVLAETKTDATVDVVTILDLEHAVEMRFLGSPTIRVDGRDVEPGADERRDFALACRVYKTRTGYSGQPVERWLRTALAS